MFANTLLFFVGIYGVASVNFHVTNNMQGAIWVGILGNSGKEPLANGGFVLESAQTVSKTFACFFSNFTKFTYRLY